jgi:hypothetical protein
MQNLFDIEKRYKRLNTQGIQQIHISPNRMHRTLRTKYCVTLRPPRVLPTGATLLQWRVYKAYSSVGSNIYFYWGSDQVTLIEWTCEGRNGESKLVQVQTENYGPLTQQVSLWVVLFLTCETLSHMWNNFCFINKKIFCFESVSKHTQLDRVVFKFSYPLWYFCLSLIIADKTRAKGNT